MASQCIEPSNIKRTLKLSNARGQASGIHNYRTLSLNSNSPTLGWFIFDTCLDMFR